MIIKVKRNCVNAIIPQFAHDTDSGFDLFTCENTHVKSGEKAIVRTGLIFEIPKGWGIQIKNKSGITILGSPTTEIKDGKSVFRNKRADITVFEGTIDMDYRGEVGIMIKNEEDYDITIPAGIKLAQGVLRKVYHCDFIEIENIDTDTPRGSGGYGSTGVTIA